MAPTHHHTVKVLLLSVCGVVMSTARGSTTQTDRQPSWDVNRVDSSNGSRQADHPLPLGYFDESNGGGSSSESNDDDDDDDDDLGEPSTMMTEILEPSGDVYKTTPAISQPLQTLQKLQQMLDETDYVTERRQLRQRISASPPQEQLQQTHDSNQVAAEPPSNDGSLPSRSSTTSTSELSLPLFDSSHQKLWTSRDRSKYKKQQRRMRDTGVSNAGNTRVGNGGVVDQRGSGGYHRHKNTSGDLSDYRTSSLVDETSVTTNNHLSKEPFPPISSSTTDLIHRQSPEGFSTVTNSSSTGNHHPSPLIHPHHPWGVDNTDETDDGLGYHLPDLPVYLSDAEGESEGGETLTGESTAGPSAKVSSPDVESKRRMLDAHQPIYPPQPYIPYHPPMYYWHQDQNRQYYQQQPQINPYLQPFSHHLYSPHPYPILLYPPSYTFPPYHGAHRQQHTLRRNKMQQPEYPFFYPPVNANYATPADLAARTLGPARHHEAKDQLHSRVVPPLNTAQMGYQISPLVVPSTLPPRHRYAQPPSFPSAPTSLHLTIPSLVKSGLMIGLISLLCYSAVSPYALPSSSYRDRFVENLCLVSLAYIAPLFYVLAVYDINENNINTVLHTFFTSFTTGYGATFVVELFVATVIRAIVLALLEPDVLTYTPKIPLPVIPWILREIPYQPRRISLFIAEILVCCVASPIVEEFAKYKVLDWTVQLPRNFRTVLKSTRMFTRRKRVIESVQRAYGEEDTVNPNFHVTHMLSASLGLKLADVVRRILMYTKPHHEDRKYFAVCRGIFPIHELCGTITAIGLAKRDLLGMNIPMWKILAPSIVVHAMANFRGMKPIFKWSSATPWLEMQLYPLRVPDSTTGFLEAIKTAYPKVMWLIVISRVFGYCVKNYYMVKRQARKRTTTYAGKHSAFSAELATAELLKKKS